MAVETMQSLAEGLEDVIDLMPPEFDSHDLIRELAFRHQRIYVEALGAYADSERPFQIVHGMIAGQLGQQAMRVAKIGVQRSPDVFGHMQEAVVWRKRA